MTQEQIIAHAVKKGLSFSVTTRIDGTKTVRVGGIKSSAANAAARAKAYRKRKLASRDVVTVPGSAVTVLRDARDNVTEAPAPPLPTPSSPSSPLSSLHPPIPAPAPPPTPSRPHPPAGESAELFPDTPAAVKPQKPKQPKAEDPRHREITSQIGGVYRDVTGEPLPFPKPFPKVLTDFLSGWTGTADDFLDRYFQALTLGKKQYGSQCRKAADPCFLCKNWPAVTAEVGKLQCDEERERKAPFSKLI